MTEKKCDYILNYIIFGDSKVGKSKLFNRMNGEKFQDNYNSTIGTDFRGLYKELDNKTYILIIVDTAGTKGFRKLVLPMSENKVCALIVYEIDKRESFENVTNWIEDFQENGLETAKMVLVGNKCDLEETRVVSKLQGIDLSLKYGMQFFETSAKKGINVNEVFTQSCELITKKEKRNNIKKDKDKKCSFLRSILEKVGCKCFS